MKRVFLIYFINLYSRKYANKSIYLDAQKI